MGYTHYWYRATEIDQALFTAIGKDFRRILPVFDTLRIRLAGSTGVGLPEINQRLIAFNGLAHCGHPKAELGITWPADEAVGIAQPGEDVEDEEWFAGRLLTARSCDGDCSHEEFYLPQIYRPRAGQTPDEATGLWCSFCKTAFKPYDVAVTSALLIAKHRLGERIQVVTDGEIKHWWDAIRICHRSLGFGLTAEFQDRVLQLPPESMPSTSQ